MKKRVLALALSIAMAGTMLAGCGGTTASTATSTASKAASTAAASTASKAASTAASTASSKASSTAAKTDEGKVYNIYCWNTEFKSRVEDFYPGYTKGTDEKDTSGTVTSGTGKIGDVTVNWIITPSTDNAYQNALDEALLGQDSADADKKVDLFLIEAGYALKYTDKDAGVAMDVKDVGLTDSDMSQQYQYTKDIVTGSDGVQRGTSWQATPGLFTYRRSIAKEVLGTDDPDAVQEKLSSWDNFDAVAKEAFAKGYKMLSGYDDSYRVFSNNMSAPWTDDSGKIVIDDQINKWIDQTKTYTDDGYNNKTSLWSDGWSADQGPEGKVFGFFYSTWGINFTLLGNSLATSVDNGGKEEVGNGIYGDWAVCQGPASWYWGGTWMCAANGSDNVSITKDIMKTLTCDQTVMKKITEDTQDYTNNQAAMKELADDPNFGSAFLGGQNQIKLFAEAAPKIDMSNAGPYDQGLNEGIQTAFKDYFDGTVDKDTAWANFYKAAIEKYPDLKQ